jgi:membrane protein implicated in regulation of membrane protease activity
MKRSRLLILAGIGAAAATLLLYALAKAYDFGVLEFAFVAVLIIVVSDFALAWVSERAIQQGKVTLHNEILGKEVTVIETFSPADARFKGRVSLGGERWSANSSAALTKGEIVCVQAREGLVLSVERQA